MYPAMVATTHRQKDRQKHQKHDRSRAALLALFPSALMGAPAGYIRDGIQALSARGRWLRRSSKD